MMLSKTTWYAFIVALCFIISKSDGILIRVCETDEDFLAELSRWTRGNVAVLVTQKGLLKNEVENQMIDSIDEEKYKIVIKLYADDAKCPVAHRYLNCVQRFPSFVMVIKNRKYGVVWYGQMPLANFANAAPLTEFDNKQPTVTRVINKGLEKLREMRQKKDAIAAGSEFNNVIVEYTAAQDNYSQGGPSGSYRETRSSTPPNWLKMAPPRREVDRHDKSKRIASPPLDYGRSQKPRLTHNWQQTPSQTVDVSQRSWGNDLGLKVRSQTPEASQQEEDDPSKWAKNWKLFT